MTITSCITNAFRRCFCRSKKERQQGMIKFFDRKKRFGFIIAGEQEYFFHATAAKPEDMKRLRDGAHVQFELTQGKKGLQAGNIEML